MPDLTLGTERAASIWDLGGLTWPQLLRRTWDGADQNDLANRAYELAYNFLLSLFPLLLFLFALLRLISGHTREIRADLFFYVEQLLPPTAYELVGGTLREVTSGSAGGGKLTIGIVSALYVASGGLTQLMSTLNAAYEVSEHRSWIKRRLISLTLTLAMSILLISSLLLMLAGGVVLDFAARLLSLNSIVVVLGKIVQWVIALAFVMFAFAVIYYFAPDLDEHRWHWITPGSVVGVLLWTGASAALRIYLHFVNTYTRTYGSLGAVMILMLWFYITGLAFLLGGQINSTIEHAAAQRRPLATETPVKKAA